MSAIDDLVKRMREIADDCEEIDATIDLRQGANTIEDLADQLDFQMADLLSVSVVRAVKQTIQDATGMEVYGSDVEVSNDKIAFRVFDEKHSKSWTVVLVRNDVPKEKNGEDDGGGGVLGS